MNIWTDQQVKIARDILGRHPVSQFQRAVEAIGKATGREVTPAALRGLFLRLGLGAPTSFCKQAPTSKPPPNQDSKFADLLKCAKKGPVAFSDLCDKLNMSPGKVKALIEEARSEKINLHVEHDHVGIRMPTPSESVQTIGVPPVVGKRQKVGVISDTHLGSKYCLRPQLQEFIEYAYSQGVRDILHPGDVLDGMYKHGLWEVSHSGLEAQAQDLYETLPQLPGLSYRAITGNHDFTFSEGAGLSVGHYLRNYFLQRGRKDLHFYGDRSAFIQINGAKFHLWHPKKGMGYARSYAIQKQIEHYSSGEKPNILLTGHWHVFCHVYERGVHGIACPTFQGGGSAFSKSLGGAPAIGGLILSWDVTEHGTLRAFNLENRSYFEVEKPHVVGAESGDIAIY